MRQITYSYEHHRKHYEREDTVRIFLQAYDVEKERAFIRRIDRFIPQSETRLLDIGCGVGLHTSLWAERNKQVTASDFSTKFRDYILQNYSFPFVWTDVLNCSITEQFDICFCMAIATIQVDEASRFQTFETLARLVRPGCFLVIVSPSNQRLFDLRSRRAELHALNERDLHKLEDLGFEVQRLFYWSTSPRRLWHSPVARTMAKVIESISSNLGIGARKVLICRRENVVSPCPGATTH